MNMQQQLKCLGLALAMAVSTSLAANAQLIINGGFEDSPAGTPALGAGDPSIVGWTIVSGSVDPVTGFQNHSGLRCLDLSGWGVGAVAQTITTVVGQQYLLDFWMAGNASSGPAIKTMGLSWGGVSQGIFTFDITGKTIENMGWTEHQVLLTATGTSTVLQFASLDNPSTAYGPCLDDVSLTIVPEPAAASLFALFGLGAFALRRRSS